MFRRYLNCYLILIVSSISSVALAHKSAEGHDKYGAAVSLAKDHFNFKQNSGTVAIEPTLLFGNGNFYSVELEAEPPLTLGNKPDDSLKPIEDHEVALETLVELNGANHGYIHVFVTVQTDNGELSRALAIKLSADNYQELEKSKPHGGKVYLPAVETIRSQ